MYHLGVIEANDAVDNEAQMFIRAWYYQKIVIYSTKLRFSLAEFAKHSYVDVHLSR